MTERYKIGSLNCQTLSKAYKSLELIAEAKEKDMISFVFKNTDLFMKKL